MAAKINDQTRQAESPIAPKAKYSGQFPVEVCLRRLARPSAKRPVKGSWLRELKQASDFMDRYTRQQIERKITPKPIEFLSVRRPSSGQFPLE
jgi:hypothetical protein